MRYKNPTLIFASALIAFAGLGGISESVASTNSVGFERTCPKPGPGRVACHVLHRKKALAPDDVAAASVASLTPSGFIPADLQSAYNLDATQGVGKTVAIVVAYDDPNAESDLSVYRAQFGLPPCTTANGCFRKINQDGLASSLPVADEGWSEEISLNLDVVSAICPNCNILLVEATTSNNSDLDTAENQAAAQPGVVAISNPYGGDEDSNATSECETSYSHPGIAVVASSGDEGYGASSPATCPNVTAVGGTTLMRDATTARGWTETAWTDGGAGCSAYIAKPAYQTDTRCINRMEADVAAVGDPNTGVAVYDTYQYLPPGWTIFGGTSIGAPLISAVYALAAPAGPNDFPVSYAYSDPGALFDITSGTDDPFAPIVNYEWTAGIGYDGPTGNGTPNGVGAFQPLVNFSLTLNPSNGSLAQGGSSTLNISTATRTGVAQTVALSASGLPAGITATFQPAIINAGEASTLSLAATQTAAPGSYTLMISAASGSQTLKATYALTVTAVVLANTSTTLTAAPSPSSVGQLVTLTASVAATAGTPTGTVSFFDGAALLETVALNGNFASVDSATLTVGNHNLSAAYSGSFGFAASLSTPVAQLVYSAGPLQPMALNSNPNPSTYQQPVNFLVKIASSQAHDPVPTGVITFSAGTGVLGTCTLAPLGPHSANCRFPSATLGVGAINLNASYSGDANYPAELGSLVQTVDAAGSNTRVEVSPRHSVLGTPLVLIATVTEKPDRGAMPGGSVTFYSNGVDIGAAMLNSGVAVLPYTFPTIGTFAVTATYAGSSTISTSASNAVNAVIQAPR